MIRRFELTDKQFALIEDLLPAHGRRGGRWNDHRTTLNGIFWWLYTGAQWHEVPERYGKAKSLYDRFNFWRADGTLDKILARLHLRLNEAGRLDLVLWCVDATSIRASRSAAGAAREKTSPTIPLTRRWAARAGALAPRGIWWRRGLLPVTPTRKDQRAKPRFDKATYRQRNVLERCKRGFGDASLAKPSIFPPR